MTIATKILFLKPGDIVRNSFQVFRVQRVKQVKATCLGMDGQLWDVRIESLREATEDEKRAFNEKHPENQAPTLRLGHLVRFKEGSAQAKKYPGVYVVIKDKNSSVSLVQAGGNLQSQYFPTVLVSLLELIKSPVKLQNVGV